MILSKHLKIVIYLILALIIAGCSKAFFYNRLDTLIGWYLDDYVELTNVQQQEFDEKLNTVLAWHRNEELSVYINFLDHVEKDLEKQINITVVNNWADEISSAYERIENKTIPLLYQTGEELNQDQVNSFLQNLWKRQAELEEEYLSRSNEEYAESNHKKLRKNLSRFLGSLNDEQDAMIKTTTSSLKRFDQAWLEERQLWYTSLEELLKRKPGWQRQFNEAYEVRKKTRTKNYHEYLDHNLKQTKLVIARVLNSRTDKQNQHIKREINNYKDEVKSIIAKSKNNEIKLAQTD